MLIFPARESTGILPKNIKNTFLHREHFEVLKIKWCTKIVVGYSHNLFWLWRKILVGRQPNNGMKFLQQVLLNLQLWFSMYIGSSISLNGEW